MSQVASTVLDDARAQELSERLADVFRTGDATGVLAADVFLDGNPACRVRYRRVNVVEERGRRIRCPPDRPERPKSRRPVRRRHTLRQG